jgi:hypothetical protein
LLLSGHPFLSRKIVLQLSRSSAERQQYELEQVRQKRRPYSTKTTVFDTVGFGEVFSRLARAGGLMNKAAQLFCRLATSSVPSAVEDLEIGSFAQDVILNCRALRRLIKSYRGGPTQTGANANAVPSMRFQNWDYLPLNECRVRDVRACLSHANGFIQKCVRDLPRATNLRPSRAQAHDCGLRLYAMITDCRRILDRLAEILSQEIDSPAQRGHIRKRVATHSRPDVDALVSVWLVERYLLAEEVEVVFVPYNHDFARQCVDCVVDMGGLYDPRYLLFEHRPPAFADRHASCAARLIWEHLLSVGKPVHHLAELVQTAHHGDCVLRQGSALYQASKLRRIHHELDRLSPTCGNPSALYVKVRRWLDRYDVDRRNRHRPNRDDEEAVGFDS